MSNGGKRFFLLEFPIKTAQFIRKFLFVHLKIYFAKIFSLNLSASFFVKQFNF